jgi:hypothetical protein
MIDRKADVTACGENFAISGVNIARQIPFGHISGLEGRELHGFVEFNLEVEGKHAMRSRGRGLRQSGLQQCEWKNKNVPDQ